VRKSLFVVVLSTISLAAFATAGTAIYRWLKDGDKIACVANEFNFGCSTTLGWVLSAVGVFVFAGAIYFWERFRGN
jgi:hypothetical protein